MQRSERFFTARHVGLLLALLLGIAYFPVLFWGSSFYYRDFGVMAVPTAWYHRESFLAGEVPLWNPFSNCGAPFLAQWGTMVLYPLSLIYVFLPFPWSLNLFCIVHLWIGGMGMSGLARRWIGQNEPAACAAVAFVFNGITLSTLLWPGYTAALGLFPWVVLLVERAWSSPGAGPVALAAAVSGSQLLAGVPEISVFTWLCVSGLFIGRLVTENSGRVSLVTKTAAIVLLAAGLAAAQLLPFFQLLEHSQRAPGFAAEKWPLPPWGWANLLLPRFHTFNTFSRTVFQDGQLFLSSTYLGGGLLLLALAGLHVKVWRVRLLGLLLLVALILSLGSAGRIYPVLLEIFPPLGVARYPVKYLFLAAFATPLLAGYGWHVLARMNPQTRRRWVLWTIGILSLVLGALACFQLAYPLYPGADQLLTEFKTNSLARWCVLIAFGALLCFAFEGKYARPALLALLVLMAADGRYHLANQNPTASAQVFTPGLWAAANQELPRPELGNGRVFISPAAEVNLLQNQARDGNQQIPALRLGLWSHLNLLDLAPKVNGSSTLQMQHQAQVQSSLYSGTNGNRAGWLDFLNVTLQSSERSAIEWDQRASPMPFITAGQAARVETGPDAAALATMNDPSFQFGTTVLLQGADAAQYSSSQVELSDVFVLPHRIHFRARTAVPALAVIAQSWHPAWRASYVGKAEVEVLRANLAFQAVPLPAGETEVVIEFKDPLFRAGAALSLISLTICVAIGLAPLARKRKRSSQT